MAAYRLVRIQQSPSAHGIEEVAVAPRQIALGDRLHVAAGAAAFQPLARLAGSYPGVAIGLGPKLDRKRSDRCFLCCFNLLPPNPVPHPPPLPSPCCRPR